MTAITVNILRNMADIARACGDCLVSETTLLETARIMENLADKNASLMVQVKELAARNAELESQKDAADAAFNRQFERAEAAEAELARRDAAPKHHLSEIVSDVENILALLKDREWAEHCTVSQLGKELEAAITELHDEAAPVVPDELVRGDADVIDVGFINGWNACRSAMLKGGAE